MKCSLTLWALVLALLASPASLSQTSRRALDPQKLFITSYFDCAVYWNGRQIATLRKGTRAQIIRSTDKWFLVRYPSGGRYILGWIRR